MKSFKQIKVKSDRHKSYYESHPLIRVDRKFKELLEKQAKRTGLSYIKIIKKMLRTKFKKGFKDGYNKGYDAGYKKAMKELQLNPNKNYNKGYKYAKKKYFIKFPCSICGKPMHFLPNDKSIKQFVEAFQVHHTGCEKEFKV